MEAKLPLYQYGGQCHLYIIHYFTILLAIYDRYEREREREEGREGLGVTINKIATRLENNHPEVNIQVYKNDYKFFLKLICNNI